MTKAYYLVKAKVLKGQGKTQPEIAESLGVTDRHVRKNLKNYDKPKTRRTRKSKLNSGLGGLRHSRWRWRNQVGFGCLLLLTGRGTGEGLVGSVPGNSFQRPSRCRLLSAGTPARSREGLSGPEATRCAVHTLPECVLRASAHGFGAMGRALRSNLSSPVTSIEARPRIEPGQWHRPRLRRYFIRRLVSR